MTFTSYSAQLWPAPRVSNPIGATVNLPGSKSLTNRELVLSALATEPTTLIAPLDSRDSRLMIEALTSLGARFEQDGENLRVEPIPAGFSAENLSIDCGLAGTVMRFVPPLAGLQRGLVHFDGDAAARRRPMRATIESLRALGISVSESADAPGQLPFEVHGTGNIEG